MFRLEIDIPRRYRLEFDKKRVRQVLQRAGAEIAAVARNKIRRASGGGRLYRGSGGSRLRPYVKGHHFASAPGQPPANWTGTLAGSIRARPFKNGDGVTVRESAYYALFLAVGAKGGIGSGQRGVRGSRNPVSRRGGLTTIHPVGARILEPRPSLSAALDEREASIAARVKEAIIEDIQFRRIAAGAKL